MKRWKKKMLKNITKTSNSSLISAGNTYNDNVDEINAAKELAVKILDELKQKVDAIASYNSVKITTEKPEVYHELAQILNVTFERRVGIFDDLQLWAEVNDVHVYIVGFDYIPGCKVTYETKMRTTRVPVIECED